MLLRLLAACAACAVAMEDKHSFLAALSSAGISSAQADEAWRHRQEQKGQPDGEQGFVTPRNSTARGSSSPSSWLQRLVVQPPAQPPAASPPSSSRPVSYSILNYFGMKPGRATPQPALPLADPAAEKAGRAGGQFLAMEQAAEDKGELDCAEASAAFAATERRQAQKGGRQLEA